MVPIGLVYSRYDPTEVIIQRMIDAGQKMLNTQGGEGAAGGGISPPIKRRLELEIKTLQNAPRDADKLRRGFESKAKTKGRSN